MLTIVVLTLLTAKAEAIEMFTNFNNGQNVGFPPMEVPISVYRGFGHGGWNPYAEGMPLKTVPPVPAMMPTGQVPHVWQQPQYSAMPAGKQQQVGSAAANAPQRLASDRRRNRWQRGSYRPMSESNGNPDSSPTQNAGDLPNPPRPEIETDSSIVTGPASSRRKPPSGDFNSPTVLHAQAGTPPIPERSLESANSTSANDDRAPQPPANMRAADFWPQANALFPAGAGD
jgi:hypothetical protein